MQRFFSIGLFVLVLSVISLAETTGYLAGRVTDEVTGNTIRNVHVSIKTLKREAKTNGEGYYLLTNVPVGVYTITFTGAGCQELTRRDTIRVNATTTVDAVLYRASGTKQEPLLNSGFQPDTTHSKLIPAAPVDEILQNDDTTKTEPIDTIRRN